MIGVSRGITGFGSPKMLDGPLLQFGRQPTPREKHLIQAHAHPPSLAALLVQLKQDPSHRVRISAYQAAQTLLPRHYTPEKRKAYLQALAQATHWLSTKTPDSLIASLSQAGYRFYFENEILLPEDAPAILKAYGWDEEDIHPVVEGDDFVLAGEVLAAEKHNAVFIRGNAKAPGYFLFSTTREAINPGQFWHEVFHALQHQYGLYENNTAISLWCRELEASGFVIDHAKQIGLSRHQAMEELEIWALRASEYLNISGTSLDRIA